MNGHKEDVEAPEWTLVDTILASLLLSFVALVAYVGVVGDGLR